MVEFDVGNVMILNPVERYIDKKSRKDGRKDGKLDDARNMIHRGFPLM